MKEYAVKARAAEIAHTGDASLARFSQDGTVGRITLSRPPVNAIDDAMVEAIDAAIDAAVHANTTVLIFASDVRAFCAGADLKMVASRIGGHEGAAAMERTVRAMHSLFDRIETLDIVTIAQLSGPVLGGGMELALACDLRVAGDDAVFGLPEPAVGLLPGAGGTQRLTRLCGRGLAARVILGGDKLNAAQATEVGIAQWNFPADQLDAKCAEIAARIAGFSRMALIESKRCIALAAMPGQGGSQLEIAGIHKLMTNKDSAARVSAFVAR